MKTVKEVSELTGVSIRTLRHYDQIGLLKPTAVSEAGYRLYDETALERLHTILLFRELAFPLKEIKEIIDSPTFNPTEALQQQIELLQRQHKHIGSLIVLATEIQSKGKAAMGLKHLTKRKLSSTDGRRESAGKAWRLIRNTCKSSCAKHRRKQTRMHGRLSVSSKAWGSCAIYRRAAPRCSAR